MRKRVVVFAATVAVIVALALLASVYFKPQAVGTPIVGYSFSYASLNTKDLNVPQGTILQLNLTFTSHQGEQMAIPLENVKLVTSNTNLIQERVFNYSLSLYLVTLEPSMSNSTILTISLAQDAPLGGYELDINHGIIKDPISGLSYSGTIPIELTVVPKTS